jgi:WW domain
MATSAAMNGLPRLPPGWTEHTAPTGHKYYYNAALKKSTYQRPTVEPPQQTPPIQAPNIAQPSAQPTTTQSTTTTETTQAIPLTEWTTQSIIPEQRSPSPERQTARIEGQDMWKLLEDRPRKTYPLLHPS